MKTLILIAVLALSALAPACGGPPPSHEALAKTEGAINAQCIRWFKAGSCAEWGPEIPVGGYDCTGMPANATNYEARLYTGTGYTGLCVALPASYPTYGEISDTANYRLNNNTSRIRSMIVGNCVAGWFWTGTPNLYNTTAPNAVQIPSAAPWTYYDKKYYDMDNYTHSIVRSIALILYSSCPNPSLD